MGSFREIFYKACIDLEKTKIIADGVAKLSDREIHQYVDSFLDLRAKILIWTIISKSINLKDEFSQPKKGSYARGLLALLFRAILKIHATTSNEADLKDKFLTLRNNLVHASFEYSLSLPACEYGKSYAMLEPFINVIHTNDTITVNATNFLQIALFLVQPEVEKLKAHEGSIDEKLHLVKEMLLTSPTDPYKSCQDFWDSVKGPLKQIDEFVDGLREHFEDDDEIMIEEEPNE
jgi:hypothetical protein